MISLNIVFNQKRNSIEQAYIRDKLGEGYNIFFPESNSSKEIIEHVKAADVLVGTNITKEMLDGSNLKLIQIPHAGVERLNFELLKQYDIPVCNSHSNSQSVAEFALGLLFGIAKKIPYHDKLLRAGNWNASVLEDSKEGLSIHSSYIYNKTVGFIGYGKIGKQIAKLLGGFDCNFMAIVSDKNKVYQELDFIGNKEDLKYVLSKVDYLVIAAPLTNETRGMINMSNILNMKKSSFIINISRGKVIEEESLFYMLDNNLIRGAAIDTWYNYPNNYEDAYPSKKYEFHKLNNIIMSPHRADAIYDEAPYIDDALYNIKALKTGKELINRINLIKGY